MFLGIVGVYLPLLPTTPFLILASFFFARSSPALHQWLLNQPVIGKYLLAWEKERAIPRRAKYLATMMIVIAVASSIVVGKLALLSSVTLASVCLAVLLYIWSHPEGGM